MEICTERLRKAEEDFRFFRLNCGRDGIGRLSEKSLHGVLKFYLDSDPDHHEVVLPEGPVADVFDGNTVVEIQTGSYTALAKKLPRVLPYHPVKVYCPILRDRYLYTLDPETGIISGGRKSPVHGSRAASLVALSSLDQFLDDPNFSLTFLLVDVAEYRTPPTRGKRKGTKLDRVPIQIADVWIVAGREDYISLIPLGLPEIFTAKDFNKKAHLRGRNASIALKLLRDSGTVSKVGNEGNTYLYKITVVKQQGGAI